MAPAEPGSGAASNEEEEEEGESTSLDLPGRPQAIAELDILQRYLLGVSHSDCMVTTYLGYNVLFFRSLEIRYNEVLL